MTNEDVQQSDLAELLAILGMGDHARPQSPHEVFQDALEVLRNRLTSSSTIEALIAEAKKQITYWRERQRVEKRLEDGVSEDSETYTPIGDEAAWRGGYCNGRMSEADWWLKTLQLTVARLVSRADLRTALGDPLLTDHSGCEEGPHVKLIYETVAEAMRAHDALKTFFAVRPKPPPETQLDALIRLRAAVVAKGGPQSRINWIDRGIAFERAASAASPSQQQPTDAGDLDRPVASSTSPNK